MARMLAPEYVSALDEGARAIALGDYDGARAIYDGLVSQSPTPEAIEGQSWVAWWQNDADTVFAARERAYQLYREAGAMQGAARMAVWLGNDYIDFRGDTAISNGWLQVAQRMLEDLPTSSEHGWLALIHGDIALLLEEDTTVAREHAQRASAIGRQVRDIDVEVMGRTIEGLALVTEGDMNQGMSLLDEAATVALSSGLQDRSAVSFVLCHLLYACERARDYERAAQWCQRTRDYADRVGFAFAQGNCRVHYASVLLWRGLWEEAERELADASRYLLESRPPWESDARVRLAELRRRQGRRAEAEALFREVDWHPLAPLGLAELELDAGRHEDAIDHVERVLRALPRKSLAPRGAALDVLIRIRTAAGDIEGARVGLAELEEISTTIGTLPFRSMLVALSGRVALASGEVDAARSSFEDAVALFDRCGAPYDAARVRLALAGLLRDQGRTDRAQREATAALDVFRGLGAADDAARAEAILVPPPVTGARHSPLTERQVEILRLVAQGLNDREIAESLVMSEHTVHRHVANILQRLDLSTRAAAVAYASQHGLL